jgi:hypothetical protein
MLRLTGARLAMLRRVVALESAVPLLAAAAVAMGTGFGATAMYASLEMQHPVVAPGAAYYLLTAGGILAALGIIAATFPLLARISGSEVARERMTASASRKPVRPVRSALRRIRQRQTWIGATFGRSLPPAGK